MKMEQKQENIEGICPTEPEKDAKVHRKAKTRIRPNMQFLCLEEEKILPHVSKTRPELLWSTPC